VVVGVGCEVVGPPHQGGTRDGGKTRRVDRSERLQPAKPRPPPLGGGNTEDAAAGRRLRLARSGRSCRAGAATERSPGVERAKRSATLELRPPMSSPEGRQAAGGYVQHARVTTKSRRAAGVGVGCRPSGASLFSRIGFQGCASKTRYTLAPRRSQAAASSLPNARRAGFARSAEEAAVFVFDLDLGGSRRFAAG